MVWLHSIGSSHVSSPKGLFFQLNFMSFNDDPIFEEMLNQPLRWPIAPLNDIFNARVFSDTFQGKIIWAKNYGGWFIWSGQVWDCDRNDRIKRFMIHIYDAMRVRPIEGTPEMRDAWIRHVKSTGQNARLDAALASAKTMMSVDFIFDSNPFLLNCPNGVVNLKTGEFKPHNPLFYQTKICEVNYYPKAECPRWRQFLREIFCEDIEVIHYMQKVIGYALSGSIEEECFFILYGSGGNGKSKFIETIAWVLNNYATACSAKTILQKENSNGINNDVARLAGARFVRTSENSRNLNLDDSLMKSLTGGEKITARFLYSDNFEFHPACKIFLSTNYKPGIGGTDDGIWRRIRMIPFNLKLKPEQIDRNLSEKLKIEAEGILNWAIEGCLLWQKEGLNSPPKVQKAINEYKQEEDKIGGFIEDECEIIKEGYIPTLLFKEKIFLYLGHRMSQKTIYAYMKQHGFYEPDFARRTIDSKQVRIFNGLTLKNQRMIDTTPPVHLTEFEKSLGENIASDDQAQIDWEA